ncbi:uncharacterized protein P174DRAFT_417882 [Aspergillus novofumigatus IBT 16806]|uniref:Uncharacterized protein n=1 Tax=Aspergillus novofumigatus (strain IBT 16806) TaxID=1392255 RepID=A0A2I1CH03_ASPN1|nr:uncharacterized protein P174DRAFT_417882 [Aspergillus novofumigatus IBT 16806]PKX96884.1 hypothetical protein P174DRAFT_417882 [Aspergillus novofumigatus IBT 16806]
MPSPPAKQQRKLINSILHHAKLGDWDALSQLLDNPDVTAAGLEYRDSNPLHEAIIGGHPEIVQRLIDRGFGYKQAQIARVLLEAGADPTRLDVTDAEETHAVSRESRTDFMTWNVTETGKHE